MSRRPSAFTLRLGAIVLAGVALRALYLYTVGRKVTGVGDWFFYHWEANDLAAGHFYVEPFRWHIAAPGDVLQKRPHLLRPFRPPEGQQ